MKADKISYSGCVLRFITSFILLASLLILPKVQAAVGDIFTDDNFKYTVLTEEGTTGTVSVAKQSDTVPSGAVAIPAAVTQGSVTYSVTSIGAAAFSNLSTLESITIPDSVTSIGVAAFNKCNSLENITIPNSVTSIGASAFAACTSLKSAMIGNGVTKIGANTFIGCSSLTLVVFKGDAPTAFGIFGGCTALETIYYVEGTSGWTNPWNMKATATLKQEDIFIISSPVNQLVVFDTDVSLEVSAFSLSDLDYQWYKDGTAIEGVTTPVYFIESTQGSDSGSYTVTISNEYASVSREATLEVITERIGDPDSDFQYSISDGVASIDGYMGSKKDIVIPNIIEGCLVNRIRDYAFYELVTPTSITIPDTVIYIGEAAFSNCLNLERVKLSRRTTEIGEGAFSWCPKLTKITIPETVTRIERNVLANWSSYPQKNILFKGDFPAKSPSFDWTGGLKATYYYIEGKNGWETSGLSDLVPCKGEFWLDDIQCIYFSDQTASLFGYTGNPVNIEIPAKITVDSVDYQITSLGNIFFGCKSLKNVAVSMDMGEIYGEESGRIFEYQTFMNCNLESIYFKGDSPWNFGGTVTGGFAATWNIYDAPLYYISGTKNWESTEADDPTMIACHNWTVADNVLYLCNEDGTAIVKNYVGYPETITIPKTITVDAREYTVIAMDERAFYRCNSLKEISILADITGIESEAFAFCTNLRSVVITDGVSKIGYGAFANCRNLVEVQLPANLTQIDDSAFYYCSGLKLSTLPETVEYVGMFAFYNCSELESMTLPNSCTELGQYAFGKCTALQNILLGSGLSEIGDGTFFECSNLESFSTGNGIFFIGDFAFLNCTGLTSVLFGDNVADVWNTAFMGCSNLTNLVVAENNPNLSSLDGVLLDKDQTTLILCLQNKSGAYTIPGSVTEIEDAAFSECRNLSSITIPASVASIGNRTFENCTGMANITIPGNVASIGDSAFSGCTSLGSALFKGNAPIMGYNVFSGCDALETIYYMEGTEGWTNPWQGIATATWSPEESTTLSFEVVAGKLVLTFSGGGLEASSDLILWNPVEVIEEGKYELDIPSTGKTFFRVAQ
jgi:hypothetical protein